jgi:osmoprotectant transport system substrate-binding protein
MLSAVMLVAACSEQGDPAPAPVPDNAIRVGSFDFSESRVLAAIYAGAMRGRGYEVVRVSDGATREIMQPALRQDLVDLLPEYLGTGLNFATLGDAVPKAAARAHDRLSEALSDDGIEVLDYSQAEDVNEFVVSATTAEELGLETISDLHDVADELVFGGPPECMARETCLLGLEDVYDLEFESFVSLDPGGPLTESALSGGEVDVAVMFSTSPALSDPGYVALKDDRRLQPPENVVPVVRTSTIKDNEGVDDVIDLVSARLTTADLRRLNELVDSGTLTVTEAAERWLEEDEML